MILVMHTCVLSERDIISAILERITAREFNGFPKALRCAVHLCGGQIVDNNSNQIKTIDPQ